MLIVVRQGGNKAEVSDGTINVGLRNQVKNEVGRWGGGSPIECGCVSAIWENSTENSAG